MFSNLLFLFLALLIIDIAPVNTSSFEIASPLLAFLLSMGLYGIVLGLIFLQNRSLKKILYRYKSQLLFFVNIELLIFLSIYHFVLGAARVFTTLPWIGNFQTISCLFSLCLYLFGLIVFHYTAFNKQRLLATASAQAPLASAKEQMRLLIPFAIPFILFTFVMDLLKFYPNQDLQDVLLHNGDNAAGTLILFGITVAFMVVMMIFLPAIIQWIWLCQPIEDKALMQRLESLCQKAHFRHAGMRTWTVMNHALTAAIIGIIPRFRYVMFTKRLTEELSPDAVEAILAHEIGHNYRRHLLIYPFIIFGMLVLAGLFSLFFGESISAYLGLQDQLHPSPLWSILNTFAIFIPYALIIAIYFRLVFGFFSRNFERQADLHVFELGVPHKHLIEALNEVAIRTGHTHHQPSWHHYSIQERLDFIQAAADDPQRIQEHHRRVKYYIGIYGILLAMALTALLAPLFPKTTFIGKIGTWEEKTSEAMTRTSTKALRENLGQKFREELALTGDQEVIQKALEKGFEPYIATQYPGLGEYFAAKILLSEGELAAANTLMNKAWQDFDFKNNDMPEIKDEFIKIEQSIGKGMKK